MPASATPSKIRPRSQLLGMLITLIVSGVILGAIWIASMSIVENFRIGRGTDQIFNLVRMSRDFASRDSSFAQQSNEDMVARLTDAGQLPARTNIEGAHAPLLNPWNLEVRATTLSSTHMLVMTRVPLHDCLRLAQFFTSNAKALGLQTADARSDWRGLAHQFFDDNQHSFPAANAMSAACSVSMEPVLALDFVLR